jgi:hypothetical protein
MDIATLVTAMSADGTVTTIARNPAAQFGRPARQYLGATILPEVLVPQNMFREDSVKYRTVIANDGTRYSPTQLKAGDLVGSMLVELGESDIARQFTSQMYDALMSYLAVNSTMEGIAQVTNWLDTAVNLALVEHDEKQRWDAIVDAAVVRSGDNGYTETVLYPNPVGNRVAQSAPWGTAGTKIMNDIQAVADFAATKGFTINRMITSRTVLAKMSANDDMRTRVGMAVVSPTGQIQSAAGRATFDRINGVLQSDGLPPIELYDLQYRTQVGTQFFLKRNVFVMLATTGRDQTIDLGDTEEMILPETIGYLAIGRPAGQSGPGRYIRMEAKDDKPPRIEAEGWQTSLPVLQEPEAVFVITGIT